VTELTSKPLAFGLVVIWFAACTPREKRVRQTLPDVVQPPAETSEGGMRTISKACPAALLAARRGGTDADRFVVPTDEDRAIMSDLVARLVARGSTPPPLAGSLAIAAGYEIVDVSDLPDTVLVREVESRRRGGGAYLFRPAAASHLVVQAPHTFFDEGTLPIACELFARAGALALFVDTAHRYKAAEADEHAEFPADVAHAARSHFQAATTGLLTALPHATVVQLHGFAQRESRASAVLSSGAARGGDPLVQRAVVLLAGVIGEGVLRFPEDTDDLGATKNVQGTAVRAAGGRFLHVEMSAELRSSLLADQQLRDRLLGALAQSLAEP
jgi:hypothetical protein